MKRIFLLLLAGCSSSAVRYDADPVRPDLPPLPPEHVLRRTPDFRYLDYSSGKEYYLRFYADENLQEEIVTLRDAGQAERAATAEERETALAIFETVWKSKGQEDRLRYHRQIYETERKRDATLIDLRIENETAALARFRERYDETLFNLRAREATNVHPKEGDELSGKFHEPTTEFLQKELARLELEIRASETRLKMLEYKRAVRDSQYRLDLSNQTRSETFDVSDLLRRYAPDRLVEQIRETVDPPSWNRPHARLEIQDSTLIVSQTAPALEKIRAHLDQLRRQ